VFALRRRGYRIEQLLWRLSVIGQTDATRGVDAARLS
jgi:hypothetical protein